MSLEGKAYTRKSPESHQKANRTNTVIDKAKEFKQRSD